VTINNLTIVWFILFSSERRPPLIDETELWIRDRKISDQIE